MSECLENADRYVISEFNTHPEVDDSIIKRIKSLYKTCFITPNPAIFQLSKPIAGTIQTILTQPNSIVVAITDTTTNKIIAFAFLQVLEGNKRYIHSVCTCNSMLRKGCCKRLMSHITLRYNECTLSLQVRVDKVYGEGLPSNPACYCYEMYGFRIQRHCTIESDGLNCEMIRPGYGRYSNDLFQNTVSCVQSFSDRAQELHQVRISDGVKTELKNVYLIKNLTKAIAIGTAGSSIIAYIPLPSGEYQCTKLDFS